MKGVVYHVTSCSHMQGFPHMQTDAVKTEQTGQYCLRKMTDVVYYDSGRHSTRIQVIFMGYIVTLWTTLVCTYMHPGLHLDMVRAPQHAIE